MLSIGRIEHDINEVSHGAIVALEAVLRGIERSAPKLAGPGVDVLEDEAMKLLKVAQIVFTFQPEFGELCESQRARLCLSFGQCARVCQAGKVAQDRRAGIYVRISHAAGRRLLGDGGRYEAAIALSAGAAAAPSPVADATAGTWLIACSANAVIVSDGFTPTLAGTAEPSHTSRFS